MPTTLEKTWQCDVNRFQNPNNSTSDSAKRCLWYLKAVLKGEVGGFSSGLWTCAGSSDSSAGAMDATDRWGSSYNGTKIVSAAPASAHSWIVLHHPTLAWEILIDYASSGTSFQASWYYSLAGFTGGDASNRPTATDEISLSAWNNLQFHSNSSDYRLNTALATDGSFVFVGVGQGEGNARFGWIFQILANTKAGDTYPAAMFLRHNAGGNGAWDRSNFAQGTTGWASMNAAGTTVINATPLQPYAAQFPYDTFSVDQQCGLYTDLPCFMGAVNSGNMTLKGRLADIRWGTSQLAASYPEPNAQTPTTLLLASVWLPFNKNINL